MALSGSEGTLLMNCKLYLGKARTELSDKGIKSLGELDQFKDVLLRVARVTPISLDKILVEVQDSVNTDRRRREDEKKKRAFETKQAEAGNLIAAKKRKMTTRTATTATIASSNNNTNKSSTQEDSELEKKTVASVKEAKDVVRDPPSSRTPSCSSSSDGTSPSERSASGIAEVMHQSTPPTSTGTLSATSRSPECHSERDNAQGDRQLNETVGTLATNTPGSRSIPSGPSSVSSISPTDPPRPSQIPSNSNAHTIHPISTHSSNTPQPTNPPSSAPSSNGKAEKTTSDVSVNFTHLSGTPARPAPLQDSVMVDAEPVSFIDKYPETAIFTDNKAMFRRLKIHFEKIIYPCFFKQSKLFRSRKQIKQVLELCGKLNFDKVQNDLLAFVVLRRQKPGSRAQIIDLGENAEPVEIFQAIKIAGVNEADAKLHRVYGQIRLVESIDRKVRSGYVPRTHEKEDRERLEDKLRREREAGMHWIEMTESMGGTGIVFVSILAGVSRDTLTAKFNYFQRACLAHIIHNLPSIQRLVECIDDSALEDFCRDGRLSDEIEEGIRGSQGPVLAFDPSDEVDSEDEDASDDDEISDDDGVSDHDEMADDDVNGENMGEIEDGVTERQSSEPENGGLGRHSRRTESPNIIDDDTEDSGDYSSDEDDIA